MTKQTEDANRLGGSPAGTSISRFGALTLAASFIQGGARGGLRAQPKAADSAGKTGVDTKPATEPKRGVGNYTMHQRSKWAAINPKRWQRRHVGDAGEPGNGDRMLNQSLELHTITRRRRRSSTRYPRTASGTAAIRTMSRTSRCRRAASTISPGSFRRDRNYFDYNLLDNSLLSTATAANPVLVPEPDSLHLFNTVRRNTEHCYVISALKDQLPCRIQPQHARGTDL